MKRMLLSLLLVLAVSACGVDIDLRELQFEPGPGPGQDVANPDEDTAEPEGIACAHVYHCMLEARADGGDLAACKAAVFAEEAFEVGALDSCRSKYCNTDAKHRFDSPLFEPEAFYLCVMKACASEMAACASGHGDWDCEQVVDAFEPLDNGTEACAEVTDQMCLLDLMMEAASDEADALGNFLECYGKDYKTLGLSTYQNCRGFCKL